jgi:ubiquinone/menaquinone biosynthesis C-methylase UbiE
LEEEEFAKSLLAHERREWQDPDKIIAQIRIKKDMTVADLACGPGFFTVPLARVVGREGRVYAVDKSKVMLSYLRSNLKRSAIYPESVTIFESDVSKTKIPSASCDIVIFANILHDLDNPKLFLKEVMRISKPNTQIVDIDWKNIDNGFGPPMDIRMSEARSRSQMDDADLIYLENIDPGPYHYGLVYRPK